MPRPTVKTAKAYRSRKRKKPPALTFTTLDLVKARSDALGSPYLIFGARPAAPPEPSA